MKRQWFLEPVAQSVRTGRPRNRGFPPGIQRAGLVDDKVQSIANSTALSLYIGKRKDLLLGCASSEASTGCPGGAPVVRKVRRSAALANKQNSQRRKAVANVAVQTANVVSADSAGLGRRGILRNTSRPEHSKWAGSVSRRPPA